MEKAKPLTILIFPCDLELPVVVEEDETYYPPRPPSNFLDSPENRFRPSRFPSQQHTKALQDHVSVDSGGPAIANTSLVVPSPTLTSRRNTSPLPLPGQVLESVPGTPTSFSQAQQRWKGREDVLDRALSDIGSSIRSKRQLWWDRILMCGRPMDEHSD